MSDSETILVAGLGSPHGDDQAGWIAVRRLNDKSPTGVKVVHLAVPHDLLDQLDGIKELHVIDACDGREERSANECLRFEAERHVNQTRLVWRSSNIARLADSGVNQLRPERLRSAGTHQLDILTVLELANCLQRLPENVALWTIPGFVFGPVSDISTECDQMINDCVAAIVPELRLTIPQRL